MTGTRSGWAACAVAAVLFGAATPLTGLLVDDAGPLTLAGLLYVGAALSVAPGALRRSPVRPSTSQWRRVGLAVVLGGGVAPVLLVLALGRTPAATVSLLLNLELVATVFIAWRFLHEDVGPRAALGVALVAGGGVLLAGAGGAAAAPGALLVAGACICWGIDNAVTASVDALSPARMTAIKGGVAGGVNLALGLALEPRPSAGAGAAALAIGAVGYGASITLWVAGARRLGAARGQAVFSMAPFVGALLAVRLTDDPLTVGALTAFGVTLGGVLLVGSASHGHRHTHAPVEHVHRHDHTDPHHAHPGDDRNPDHAHAHEAIEHDHGHLPDVHHRHDH